MAEETKKKIFIVDDDNFLLDMYALKFSQSGYEVIISLGSEDALQKMRGGLVPDVMLLDIMMPVMDGFEMLEKMKEENLCQTTLRIILSNRGQQSDIARGEALGASGYIVKASSTPAEVITKVADMLNSHK